MAKRQAKGELPLVTGLAVIAVYGTDLARSRAFYEDVLGFEHAGDVSPGVMLRRGDATIYLEGGRGRSADAALSGATLSACFTTDSVQRAFERIREADVPIVEPFRELAPGFAMFRVTDPDGNVLELAGKP